MPNSTASDDIHGGLIRVRDWAILYETHRTRELKRMEWIPIPNKMDGDGYTELVDDPNGAAHLGVWLCILQIASKCDPRGTLTRGGGVAHTPRSIARISRIPAQLCGEAIARLVGIGWLEEVEPNSHLINDMVISRANPAQSRAVPPNSADYKRMNGMEGNGTEGNGREAPADSGGSIPTDQFFEERYALHPKKRDRVLAETVFCQIAGIETAAVQDKFRAGHDAWVVTDDFTWKGGAKCPTFAVFITDRTWEYPPHVVAKDATPASPYAPYKPPTGETESYDELLDSARKEFAAKNVGREVTGPYVRYKAPV
jgi:hypothetical protein